MIFNDLQNNIFEYWVEMSLNEFFFIEYNLLLMLNTIQRFRKYLMSAQRAKFAFSNIMQKQLTILYGLYGKFANMDTYGQKVSIYGFNMDQMEITIVI